jgi:hypothetical protein
LTPCSWAPEYLPPNALISSPIILFWILLIRFCLSYSTKTLLAEITTDFKIAKLSSEFLVLTFFDLSAAFVTVDHIWKILFMRLQDVTFTWLYSLILWLLLLWLHLFSQFINLTKPPWNLRPSVFYLHSIPKQCHLEQLLNSYC